MTYSHFYQLVRDYGDYDIEYTLHEARQTSDGNIEIQALPFVLTGNRIADIVSTLKQIQYDITTRKPIDKSDCNIWHNTLWVDELDYDEDAYSSPETLDTHTIKELGFDGVDSWIE